MRLHTVLITTAAATALLLSGCDAGETSIGAASASDLASSSATATEERTLTVFAAASLKTTFTQLGTQFEAAHPGTTVTFSFAGSSDLVSQLTEGAPADVFASADENHMTKVTDVSLAAGEPVDFATQHPRDRHSARQPRRCHLLG